jgi:hypothetical protein
MGSMMGPGRTDTRKSY